MNSLSNSYINKTFKCDLDKYQCHSTFCLYICCGDVFKAYERGLIVTLAYQQTHGHSTLRSVHFTARKVCCN